MAPELPPSSQPPASPPALTQARQGTLAQLRAIIVLALLLPAIAYVVVVILLRQQAQTDARAQLDRSARIAQEHALKLFETNEMLLERMLDILGNDAESELLAGSDALHHRLKRMAAELPQVQGLFVNGADSRSIANSRAASAPQRIDYSDREWYGAHRRGGAEVFVTAQIVSRLTGELAFDMSRRRVAGDGSFAGTVHVSLKPKYLTDFYEELGTTVPGLHVAVVRNDGQLLASWPEPVVAGRGLPPDDAVMKQLAAGVTNGTADGASPFDGTDRLRAFRRLGHYPLVVIAAIDRDVVTAQWRRRAALLALFVLPTSLGFAWMAWLALRRTREELEALQHLDDEKARRQRMELMLMQSQKLEAMGRLTGAVAHDFNNLLMVINSNLYMHRRLTPAVAGSGQLAAIERAVDSGSKLTRQLLAFARKQALMPERIELQQRLPVLNELVRPLLGSAIRLVSEVADDTAPIEVDAAELELALINLAVNAKDAMGGNGCVVISARNAVAGELPPGCSGEYVVIDVTDTGPGIPPDVARQAFEPFFTTKPLGHGTGLGLSQVQALCQSANGHARIESLPQGGVRVRMFLARSDGVAAATPPTDGANYHLDCRLLLVEDNDAVAGATRELLESMGCKVERADSGQSALQRIEADPSRFDLVLSDIELPGGLDGIAFAAALARQQPQLPVVLMTGYAVRLEQAVKQQLDVLPKPCSPAMLAEAIGKALARQGARA